MLERGRRTSTAFLRLRKRGTLRNNAGQDNMQARNTISSSILFIVAFSIAAAQPPEDCPRQGTYGNDAAASRRVVVNGISLYYEAYGQGSPLLLIHGNGGSIDRVRCQLAYFAKTRRVIAVDSRTHGRSDNGPAPLKYEQIADDLAELVRALGFDRIDVLGHSDGGNVALLLAIRHPSIIGKVVASSPNLTPDAVLSTEMENPRKQLALAMEKIAVGDTSQDWKRLQMQKEMVVTEPHITVAALHTIAAPVLVMGGDNDAMPVSHFVEIAKAIPEGQLAVLPGANHGMHQNQHDLYNAIANRFLQAR